MSRSKPKGCIDQVAGQKTKINKKTPETTRQGKKSRFIDIKSTVMIAPPQNPETFALPHVNQVHLARFHTLR
jgi:hypothetical protein